MRDALTAAIADAEDMSSRTVRAVGLAGVVSALAAVAAAMSIWARSGSDPLAPMFFGTAAVFGFVAFVFVVRWFSRVYGAADLAGRVAPLSPSYLVWVWIIPVLNLFRPKQLVNDVWRATEPDGEPGVVPRLLTVWWVVYIFPSVALTRGWGAGSFAIVVVDYVVSAYLTIRVVRTVTERLGRLRAAAPAPEPVG